MRWPHAVGMLVAAVVASITLTTLRDPQAGINPQLQVAAATALIPVLLGWFILLMRRPRLAWIGFVIALGVMAWLQWQGRLLFDLRVPASPQEMAAVVDPTPDAASPPKDQRSDAQIRKEMALTYQEALARIEANGVAYKQRQAALHLETVLAPRNLTSRKGIEQGRAKIKAVAALGQEQAAELRQISQGLDQWVDQNVPTGPAWQAFWGQHRHTTRARDEVHAHLLDIQRKQVQEIEGALSLMEANLGRMRVQGDALVFPDQSTLREYSAILAFIERLVQEETEIKAQSARDSRQATLDLQRMAASDP